MGYLNPRLSPSIPLSLVETIAEVLVVARSAMTNGRHMRSDRVPQRNPLARRRAYARGQISAPSWGILEFILPMGEGAGHCEGGIYLEEEDPDHPEQIPLLALRQVDDEANVCGEVWFSPADLPLLISALQEQWRLNISRDRRWRGMADGPRLDRRGRAGEV